MNKRFPILLLFLVVSCHCFSQGLHTSSNNAAKAYNEGMSSYDYLDYDKAEAYFNRAVSIDKRFFEAYMMLGEIYYKKNDFERASKNYLMAVDIDSNAYRPVFFPLAESLMACGNYVDAVKHYRSYLRTKNISEKNQKLATKNLKNCEFAIKAMNEPVSFYPENIGLSINSDDDEYWPSITADGQTLMFTRQLFSQNKGQLAAFAQEDFYVSNFIDGEWTPAGSAGRPINTPNNEGAQSLSSGGNYMFFTACERPGGLGSCDLYFSAFNNGQWTIPANMNAPINTKYWESTPSINADGDMLFFSSNRPGGFGGKDIWYSVMDVSGKWMNPKNLGPTVNTEYDELSPFIHFDGVTLYFASNGHPGMGGLDLYMTSMLSDSTWTEPRNLGYPINTVGDDMGLVINAMGDQAYFSSIRTNSQGKDIYSFELDRSIRPNPVSYIKGRVSDKETGKLLAAEFELINLSADRIALRSNTDEHGNFLICLPSGYNYGINISKPGYLFFSESFMFEGGYPINEPLIKNVNLQLIKIGEKMLLKNVFYEIDSWELKPESKRELNNLVKLMEQNKGVCIQVDGHTDSTGSDEYNMVLSEKRALSVIDYLVSKGISLDRLSYRGYGKSNPIGDNVTTEGRSLNRRTEVLITDI